MAASPMEWTLATGDTPRQGERVDPEAISLKCIGPDGEPLRGVSFVVHTWADGRLIAMNTFLGQDVEPGTYRFKRSRFVPRAKGASRPSLVFEVSSARLGTRVLSVTDDASDYTVRFREPLDVELKTFGEGEEKFFLYITSPGSTFSAAYDLSERREFLLRGLQGDRLRVEWVVVSPSDGEAVKRGLWDAAHQGPGSIYELRGHVVDVDEFELTADASPAAIFVPSTVALTVDASAFPSRREFVIERSARPPEEQAFLYQPQMLGFLPSLERKMAVTSNEDGRFVVPALDAGNYTLWTGEWYRPLDVRLEVDTAIVFPRDGARALRVELEDALGGLASAGLKHDDRIVGRDGRRFASMRQARRFLVRSHREPLVALVQRGDELLQLDLDPLGGQQNWGGALRPDFGD